MMPRAACYDEREMNGELVVTKRGAIAASELGLRSRASLDAPLAADAELVVARVADRACVLGAFQRASQLQMGERDARSSVTAERRGSGGPEVMIAPGNVWMLLSLAHPAALVRDCDAARIVNRHVRPLLAALAKRGAPATFAGRDWIAVKSRPAAWIGFAHDATTGRTAVEAFVAVRGEPFARAERASFRGKAPGTLEEIVGKQLDEERVVDAIVDAYGALATRTTTAQAMETTPAIAAADDPPWAATVDDAIGTIGAGPDRDGVLRIGGDLMVSRDALAALERDLAASMDASDADAAAIVERALVAPGVALEGARIASIVEVVNRASARSRALLRGSARPH